MNSFKAFQCFGWKGLSNDKVLRSCQNYWLVLWVMIIHAQSVELMITAFRTTLKAFQFLGWKDLVCFVFWLTTIYAQILSWKFALFEHSWKLPNIWWTKLLCPYFAWKLDEKVLQILVGSLSNDHLCTIVSFVWMAFKTFQYFGWQELFSDDVPHICHFLH